MSRNILTVCSIQMFLLSSLLYTEAALQAHTHTRTHPSLHILGLKAVDRWVLLRGGEEPHLILQMKERRAPILIRTDDCGPSFFTVPVLRSSIRP